MIFCLNNLSFCVQSLADITKIDNWLFTDITLDFPHGNHKVIRCLKCSSPQHCEEVFEKIKNGFLGKIDKLDLREFYLSESCFTFEQRGVKNDNLL